MGKNKTPLAGTHTRLTTGVELRCLPRVPRVHSNSQSDSRRSRRYRIVPGVEDRLAKLIIAQGQGKVQKGTMCADAKARAEKVALRLHCAKILSPIIAFVGTLPEFVD